jgi:hypothetical protein
MQREQLLMGRLARGQLITKHALATLQLVTAHLYRTHTRDIRDAFLKKQAYAQRNRGAGH